jgi:hypothetical protein
VGIDPPGGQWNVQDTSLLALPTAGDEHEQGGIPMIYEWRTYEWRTYEAMPGKFPALHTHLKVAAGLFQQHGLGVLGYWTEVFGTSNVSGW